MPTYEYECDNCYHFFEEWQTIKSDKLKVCPQCNKESLRRLFGTPTVFVKGTPQTVGELADANSKKFGRQECEERELKAKEQYQEARKAAGAPINKKKNIVPWWRSGKQKGLDRSDKPIDENKITKYKKDLQEVGSTVKTNTVVPNKIKKRGKNGKRTSTS